MRVPHVPVSRCCQVAEVGGARICGLTLSRKLVRRWDEMWPTSADVVVEEELPGETSRPGPEAGDSYQQARARGWGLVWM